MGRKQKKTTEAGQSSSEGSLAMPATKGAAGAGGKSYPSSEDSLLTDSQKEKQQKKQKQSTTVAGGGQESGKTKRKTNDRDSSEEMKKQGAKQKARSSRGGASVASSKPKVANGGCCSVFCCVTVLSVLVAVMAAAGYAGYMAYPDESMHFIESADVELRQLYRSVREVVNKKLDEILIAVGQKTPDKTEPGRRSTEEDYNRLKEESKEEEDEADDETFVRGHVPEDEADEETVVRKHVPEDEAHEETVVRGHVPEDEADEETVAREHVPEDEADEETVARELVAEDEADEETVARQHVPEVHEEKKQAEERIEVPTESKVDETVEGSDIRTESELDSEIVDEESPEKDFEEEAVSEERPNETGEEEVTEEEVIEDDEEQADESKDKEVKHWETEEEEKVKGDMGSSDEQKESFESVATESIRAEEPVKSNNDETQADAQIVPGQVEERTEDIPVVKEHDVPKQEVPEPEVVHREVPEPETPRVVVPVEEALESEVFRVKEAVLDAAEGNFVEEQLGKEAQGESEAPAATEHFREAVQSEEPVKKEEPEEQIAFEGRDVVETEAGERDLKYSDGQGDVKQMEQPTVEEIRADIPASKGAPIDAHAGEEQVLQPIPPDAETESQDHQAGDEVEVHTVLEPSTQSAETQQSAEFHPPQEDAAPERQEERFESKKAAAENVAAESSDEKSAEDELESQLDYLDGVAGVAPRESIEMYNRILDVVPGNPRAIIGKAYALGVAADVEQNDVVLEQSINEYLKVFTLPSVPKPLMVAAARACAEKQTLRGWINAAAQTLKSLVAMYPDDLELYNELGQKYVINGAYEDARATFREILNKDPTDTFAMLNLGYVMKLVDKDLGHSLDLMKTGLVTVHVTDLKFYMELGESLTKTGRHNEAHEVYQLAVDRKLLSSVWQRSWYNVDGLTSRPWWTTEQTQNMINLQMLEDFWTVIRDEAMGILANRSELFQLDSRDVIDSGEMKHLKLFINGRKMTENCDAAVKTCALLDAFSDATECKQCEVKFSLMQPRLHMRPHCGPTNSRVTAQLPLVADMQTRIRVADQTGTYVSGKLLIFDDSFEQELWVASESFQLLLTVEMWHPDLSVELRKTLGPL